MIKYNLMEGEKIPLAVGVLMIAVAFILESFGIALSFVTFGLLGWVTDIVMAMLFGIWFFHMGINIFASRSIFATLLVMVWSAIPLADITFPWTIRVAYTAFTARRQGGFF